MRILLVAAALLVGVANAETVVRMPQMPSPRAVDHVMVMVANRGSGPPGEDRHAITRSGPWLRDDLTTQGRTEVHHADLRSGTSFSYARGEDGRIRNLHASRNPRSDRYHRYRRADTGRRATALGESCRVWSTTRLGVEAGHGVNWLSCETEDGVQLWRRAESMGSGSELSSARAVSLARRPVRADQARIPADFFRLDSWRAGAIWRDVAGYRVRLVQQSGTVSRERFLQRQGDWGSSDTWGSDGSRRLFMYNNVAALVFHHESGRRPVLMQITRQSAEWSVEQWVEQEGRPPEIVLGERCRWMRWAALVADAFHLQCQAEDGVPLKVEEGGRGRRDVFVATNVRRGRLRPSWFVPPREARSAAAWGAGS